MYLFDPPATCAFMGDCVTTRDCNSIRDNALLLSMATLKNLVSATNNNLVVNYFIFISSQAVQIRPDYLAKGFTTTVILPSLSYALLLSHTTSHRHIPHYHNPHHHIPHYHNFTLSHFTLSKSHTITTSHSLLPQHSSTSARASSRASMQRPCCTTTCW